MKSNENKKHNAFKIVLQFAEFVSKNMFFIDIFVERCIIILLIVVT